MPDEQRIEQEHAAKEREKDVVKRDVEGAAGSALVSAGCLLYALIPFSVVIIVILVVWLFGAINS